MRILISLPVYQRAWILPKWFECIENQTIPLSDIGFQFELGPDDDETHDFLWEWQMAHPECFLFDAEVNVGEKHWHHQEGKRTWKRDEYLRMVTFRNNLLDLASVRLDQFDRYLSLDSDVLLENPRTLEILAEHNKDVVSPLMFMMTTGIEYPNSMHWAYTKPRFVAKRNKVETGLQRIDIPMAAVMMSPRVVENVRYTWHAQGEDIGFATNLFKLGFESYIDYDLYTPHIMHKAQLQDYLENGDNRG